MKSPSIIVLAGPNGAGKTTASTPILRDIFRISEFVNADVIAQGLSGFAPEHSALEAGRIMLQRLQDLADAGASFSFETTLASRSFAPWLRHRLDEGYRVHLFYFWLPSADLAIARVAQRVRLGGHYVDDDTIRRRYTRGIANFFQLYRPICTTWRFYDNSQPLQRSLIARGSGRIDWHVERPVVWQRLRTQYDTPPPSRS